MSASDQAPELRPEVLAFALMMEAKLREHDELKGATGWKHMEAELLCWRIWQAASALDAQIDLLKYAPTPERIAHVGRQAANVANFAMMVADVCGAIALPPAPPAWPFPKAETP